MECKICFNYVTEHYIHVLQRKVVPVINQVPRHEDIQRSGDIAPHILNLTLTSGRLTPGEGDPGTPWIGG